MNKGIELLLKQRHLLIGKKESIVNEIDAQILDIESSIEIISGKKVWEMESQLKYDDENPDYIKASLEEI